MNSNAVEGWIEANFPGEMGLVLKDKATENLYTQLMDARMRGEGIDVDEVDEDAEPAPSR
jgi:hypothetical protein